jgi:hypothetical protein
VELRLRQSFPGTQGRKLRRQLWCGSHAIALRG